jgi:hypothetical protein
LLFDSLRSRFIPVEVPYTKKPEDIMGLLQALPGSAAPTGQIETIFKNSRKYLLGKE